MGINKRIIHHRILQKLNRKRACCHRLLIGAHSINPQLILKRNRKKKRPKTNKKQRISKKVVIKIKKRSGMLGTKKGSKAQIISQSSSTQNQSQRNRSKTILRTTRSFPSTRLAINRRKIEHKGGGQNIGKGKRKVKVPLISRKKTQRKISSGTTYQDRIITSSKVASSSMKTQCSS